MAGIRRCGGCGNERGPCRPCPLPQYMLQVGPISAGVIIDIERRVRAGEFEYGDVSLVRVPAAMVPSDSDRGEDGRYRVTATLCNSLDRIGYVKRERAAQRGARRYVLTKKGIEAAKHAYELWERRHELEFE